MLSWHLREGGRIPQGFWGATRSRSLEDHGSLSSIKIQCTTGTQNKDSQGTIEGDPLLCPWKPPTLAFAAGPLHTWWPHCPSQQGKNSPLPSPGTSLSFARGRAHRHVWLQSTGSTSKDGGSMVREERSKSHTSGLQGQHLSDLWVSISDTLLAREGEASDATPMPSRVALGVSRGARGWKCL